MEPGGSNPRPPACHTTSLRGRKAVFPGTSWCTHVSPRKAMSGAPGAPAGLHMCALSRTKWSGWSVDAELANLGRDPFDVPRPVGAVGREGSRLDELRPGVHEFADGLQAGADLGAVAADEHRDGRVVRDAAVKEQPR